MVHKLISRSPMFAQIDPLVDGCASNAFLPEIQSVEIDNGVQGHFWLRFGAVWLGVKYEQGNAAAGVIQTMDGEDIKLQLFGGLVDDLYGEFTYTVERSRNDSRLNATFTFLCSSGNLRPIEASAFDPFNTSTGLVAVDRQPYKNEFGAVVASTTIHREGHPGLFPSAVQDIVMDVCCDLPSEIDSAAMGLFTLELGGVSTIPLTVDAVGKRTATRTKDDTLQACDDNTIQTALERIAGITSVTVFKEQKRFTHSGNYRRYVRRWRVTFSSVDNNMIGNDGSFPLLAVKNSNICKRNPINTKGSSTCGSAVTVSVTKGSKIVTLASCTAEDGSPAVVLSTAMLYFRSQGAVYEVDPLIPSTTSKITLNTAYRGPTYVYGTSESSTVRWISFDTPISTLNSLPSSLLRHHLAPNS